MKESRQSTNNTKDQIIGLFAAGYTEDQIVNELHISSTAISRALAKFKPIEG